MDTLLYLLIAISPLAACMTVIVVAYWYNK